MQDNDLIRIKKEEIFNNFISNKKTLCNEESLLTNTDKEKLKKMTTGGIETSSNFFMIISDELQMQKKYKRRKSYLYTYKQAQAIAFCLKQLGHEPNIDIFFDEREVKDILTNYHTSFDIIKELNYLILDYIQISKKGAEKNAGYKKRIKTNI